MSMEHGLDSTGEQQRVNPAVAAFAGRKVTQPDGRQVEEPQGYLPGDAGTFAYIARNHHEDDPVIISGAD